MGNFLDKVEEGRSIKTTYSPWLYDFQRIADVLENLGEIAFRANAYQDIKSMYMYKQALYSFYKELRPLMIKGWRDRRDSLDSKFIENNLDIENLNKLEMQLRDLRQALGMGQIVETKYPTQQSWMNGIPHAKSVSVDTGSEWFDNLEGIKSHLKVADEDWVHVGVGYEGFGKSTLSIWSTQYFYPKLDATQITFTPKSFLKALKDAKPFTAVIADEGVSIMFIKKSMDRESKAIEEAFSIIREKNLFIWINLPRLHDINPNVLARARTVSNIEQKGVFKFYSPKSKERIKINRRDKTIKYPSSDLVATFPKIDNELWNEYLDRKRESRTKRLDATLDKMEFDDDVVYSVNEAAKKLMCATGTLYKQIKMRRIPIIRKLNRVYLTEGTVQLLDKQGFDAYAVVEKHG